MFTESKDDLGLAAFAPAEGSKPHETPYGSLQLAGGAIQQTFNMAGAGLGGTLVVAGDESEEDDEDDDDEDSEGGNKKRKRAWRVEVIPSELPRARVAPPRLLYY